MTVPARLSILVVDDNRSSADALARLLRKQGDAVHVVYDGEGAIERIRTTPPDIVLTDLKMEPVDGMAVLQAARSRRPPIETIVFTAYGAVDVAVQAMHLGARDFLTKPVTVEQVAARLDDLRAERFATEAPEAEPDPVPADDAFVAFADSSRALLATLERASGVPSPVWIEGEIGSGRVYCARTIHRLGQHSAADEGVSAPLTVYNVTRDDPWPSTGTVLLPTVDDLGDDLQLELYRRLATVPEGVRIIATARPDGRRQVAEGALRPELYYKLAVVVIPVPPLRRRTEDIVPLFRAGLRRFAARYARPEPEVPGRVRDLLLRHFWPGNIRELLNLAERTVVLGEDGFHLEVIDDTGSGMPKLEPGFSLADHLEGVERRILIEALRRTAGDRAAAGKLLGVERNTLRYKLNKYGLLDR